MQILLLPLLCLIANAFASYQPGIELQVHQRGINEAIPLLKRWVEENMKYKISIPDKAGDFAAFYFNLTSFNITEFKLSSISVQLREPNAVELNASGVWTEVSAHYEGGAKVAGVKFPVSGSEVRMQVNNSDIYAIFELSTSANGHPQLNASTVVININNFAIDFHPEIVDKNRPLLVRSITSFLKPIINLAASETIKKMINEYVNPHLAQIPLYKEFSAPAQGFHIDYHLTSDPVVKGSSITVPFRGKFWYDNHQNDPQIPVANGVIHPANTNEMICFVLDGDEVFGSAAYALQVSPLNKFDLNIIEDSEKREKIKNFLKCSCGLGDCIGSFIPAIQRDCPSSGSVAVDVKLASAPAFHVNTSGVSLDASFAIHLAIVSAGGAVVKDLLNMTADVGLLFETNLRIEGWTIKQNITMTHTRLSLGSSKLDSADTCSRILEIIWEAAMKLVIGGALNKVTTEGIQLPAIPNAKLINPRFIFDKYTFALCSDVQATL